MTSPTLIYRELTFTFARSVTPAGVPNTLQIVVTPLGTASSGQAGATFIELPTTREVTLANAANTVTFRLVPSDLAGLSQRVLYRVAWRTGGQTGRTFTYDFAMPDVDLSFEHLASMAWVIDGKNYLQDSDLGVAGRVARLNDAGQVVDADGTVVAAATSVTNLQTQLASEVTARTQAITGLQTQLTTALSTHTTDLTNTTTNALNAQRADLLAQLNNESLIRQNQHTAVTGALAFKADLVNNKIPLEQIPDITRVTSVNGHNGEVSLALADLPGSITQGQVLGLATTLAGKVDTAALTAASARITAIENDPSIVKKVNGVIPHALNDDKMAYVDETGQYVTRKDGTIISGSGGTVGSVNGKRGDVVLSLDDLSTGSLAPSRITGLTSALAAKVDSTDARLTNSRIPTAHAASHGLGGTDALSLDVTQITGLATTLSNHTNRLGSLESRVSAVEQGGGGSGGSGAPIGTSIWWAGETPTGTFSDLALHSPFGYNPTNPAANGSGFYFDPAGAASADVRFPYIDSNGYLALRTWDPQASPEPVRATQADLDALATVVSGKASTSALDNLATGVNSKASQSALDSLTATVNTKAAQNQLDALIVTVAAKANQTTVDGKADQSALTSLASTVSALSTTVDTKATLTNGLLDLSTIPAIPQSRIIDLNDAFSVKADLTNGTVPLTQLPSLPQSKITDLASTLAAKADLVNGVVPTSQLPALAYTTTVPVGTKAAMLALTTAEVQPGDICIITGSADQGSYILTATDPSDFANWSLLTNPTSPVSSVNGQTGTVTLSAANVGALATDASIPQSQVTGLVASLSSKVDTSAYTAALASRPTWNQGSGVSLESVLSTASPVKARVNYVCTVNVPTLAGASLRSDDGTTNGSVMASGTVLLTAQTSSIQNGIYQISSGNWTRVSDMPGGSYLVRGTMVAVASGLNAATLWQSTSSSGVVDSAANNWVKVGSIGSAYTANAGNGITLTGTTQNQTFAVQAAPAVTVGSGTTADPTTTQSRGIVVDTAGVQIDKDFVARKYTGTVPAGSTTPRIYHNLGTRRVMVQVQEISTGVGVLVGWQASGLNYVDLEFATAPSTGQWAVLIIG